MSCCGDGKIKTVRQIAQGYVNLFIEQQFDLNIWKCPDTDRRIRICQSCEFNTWLKKTDYLAYIPKHLWTIIKNFEDMTRLPDLPKEDNASGKRLFCQKCKCYITAAARVQDKKCPESKW